MAGNRATYWKLQLAGWTVFGALNAAVALWMAHLPVSQAIVQAIALGGMGVGLSHLLDMWVRARGLATRSLKIRVFHIVGVSLIAGIPAGILTTLGSIAPWQTADLHVPEGWRWTIQTAVHALNWTVLLLIWSILYFSLRSLREQAISQLRQSELARALQLAELRLLKTQLNPHFLFNALNTVRALIAEDPPRAQDAVTHLARTLRYTLNSAQDELVTLERELAIVDDYLAIEALRLGDRLSLVREISPMTRTQRIPIMLLQMLVENAIKHGIAELPRGGVLKIGAQIEDRSLILTVANARPRSSAAQAGSDSIGLRNSAERLRLLFGPSATLDLDVTQPDCAVARVSIPCNP